jgi:hypothetical protein
MTDKAVPAKIRLNKDLEIEDPVGKLHLCQVIYDMFYLFMSDS